LDRVELKSLFHLSLARDNSINRLEEIMIQRKIIAKTISKNRTTKSNWIMFDCSWLRDEAMRAKTWRKKYISSLFLHNREFYRKMPRERRLMKYTSKYTWLAELGTLLQKSNALPLLILKSNSLPLSLLRK